MTEPIIDTEPCITAGGSCVFVALPHELTVSELDAVPEGTVLHWTNWPGRPSRPVTRVNSLDGNITFEGTTMFAMPDELTRVPRAGLEVHA
jgi:hypothetical protein